MEISNSVYSTSWNNSETTLIENYPILLSPGQLPENIAVYEYLRSTMVPLQFDEESDSSSCSESSSDDSVSDAEENFVGDIIVAFPGILMTYTAPLLAPQAAVINMSNPTFTGAIAHLGLTKECLNTFATFPVQERIVLRSRQFENKMMYVSCTGGVRLGFLLSSIHKLLHTEFAEKGSFSIAFDAVSSIGLVERRKGKAQTLKGLLPQGKKIRLLERLGFNSRFVGVVGDTHFPGRLVVLFQ